MKKQTDKDLEREVLEFCKTKDETYARQSAARKAYREDPANAQRLILVRQRMAIAKLLYDIRKKAGLSQKQIAEKMNTNQATVAKLERGKRNMTIDTIERYAIACGARLEIKLTI